MLLMLPPILRVPFSQFPVMYHKQILRIVLLGGLGEIERACDNGLSINNHHLVVCNGMLGIYLDRYP